MNDIQTSPDSTGPRRTLLLGVGAVAAAAGLGLAWWRAAPRVSGATTEPIAGFWSQQWDAPQGPAVALQQFRGRPLLINFWATWCPPCIEELPLIDAFYQKNKANGWQVLGLAIDRPSSVQAFLQKMPLHFPVGLAGLTGSDLAQALGNPSGSLPFSVVVGAEGGILQRKLGRLRAEDLALWAGLK